jgi:hypothetical protein
LALLLSTAVLGVLGSSAVLGYPLAERTFAGVLAPAQLLMSLLVPLIGIVVVSDLRQPPSTCARDTATPAILAALVLAALLAMVGSLFAALALALSSTTAPDPWRSAALLVLGSLLAQVVAVLTGTGLGLLVPSYGVAFGLTLLPVALWLALGVAGPSRAVRDWILPYGPVRHLLGATMTAASWGSFWWSSLCGGSD